MRILEDYKIKRLSKLSQVLLLDEHGIVRDSCDALFPTTRFRSKSIFGWFPLIESIFPSIIKMEIHAPELRVSKVERPSAFLPGFYDFTFSKIIYEEDEELILWSILDFTKPYEDFLAYQQRRNEFEIHLQKMEWQKKEANQAVIGDDASISPPLKFFYQEGIHLSYFNTIIDILRSPVNILDSISISLYNSEGSNGLDYLSKLNVSVDFIRTVIAEYEVFYQHFPSNYQLAQKQEFELKPLITQIITQVNENRLSKDHELIVMFDENLPKQILGFPTRFAQVLYYAISNADKFGQRTKTSLHFNYKHKENQIGELELEIVEQFIDSDGLKTDAGEKKIIEAGLVFRMFLIKKLVELQDGYILAKGSENADQLTIYCTLPMEVV